MTGAATTLFLGDGILFPDRRHAAASRFSSVCGASEVEGAEQTGGQVFFPLVALVKSACCSSGASISERLCELAVAYYHSYFKVRFLMEPTLEA